MEQSFDQYETLSDGLRICVSDAHKFGTDAFLLSDFARHRRRDLACDLGTGCGIIPLLWFRRDPPAHVWAVDLQEQAIAQLRQTIACNHLEETLTPILADLRQLQKSIPIGTLTLVTCNPPYKAQGTGILSGESSERIARHEVMCSIADVCATAATLLRFGGRLCVCQRPERLVDTLDAMRAHGLEPKRLRFVQQRSNSAPWLFLAEGKKGSKPFLQVEPPLIIEGDGRDGFSAELLEIYGGGKQ